MSTDKPRSLGTHRLRAESLMMSYGYDPQLSEGALKSPIFQTSTFVFKSAEDGKAFFELAYGLRQKGPTEELGLIYSRLNNPDLEILEDRLTLWDEAEACAVFESGMAAIATTLFEFVRPGDAVLSSAPLYGGTDYLLTHVLARQGIVHLRFPAGASLAEMERAVASGGARPLGAIFVETPANPTNQLVDIGACAELARRLARPERKVPVIVDNTFLGPLWQQPLKHGADLVIYSATKFLGGHSDLIAGACLGSRELIERVRTLRTFLGTMAGPWTGWLLMRSLETLKLRMTCQMKNARYVADFLADHPKVASVHYLGHLREEDPQWALYRKQCASPGSVISFEVVGGEKEAFRLLNELKLIKLAVSLGGTESLAEHPATMTHADVEPDAQRAMGITPAMVRLSVGVEHPEDLLADLAQALEGV
ncbi:MAG: cystathionine gamma-synthase family protein [Deltaproteobacteria bacterium]|nr:cystathionine gamma-synthase family protein [Deltaproteobacteria bacterium]